MRVPTKELPIAVMIMAHIKDGAATFKNVLAAENGSIVWLLKRPSAIKPMRVRAHDA